MSEKIESVLTAEEWVETRAENDLHESVAYWTAIKLYAAGIALLNDALDDSDPRKITRAMVPIFAKQDIWRRTHSTFMGLR